MKENVKNKEGEKSLPSSVAAHFDAHGVSEGIWDALEVVSSQAAITSNLVADTYVSISPAQGGFIAGYVHHERLTVAMPPAKAIEVGLKYGWEVEPDSGVTSYLKIPATGLATPAQRSVAWTLLVDAVRWRALGPRESFSAASGGVNGTATKQICPLHHIEMLGGQCDQCSS